MTNLNEAGPVAPNFDEFFSKLALRTPTMKMAVQLMLNRKPKTLIETGTMRPHISGELNWRGDGCSTVLFSVLAEYLDADFWTVDISEESIKFAAANTNKPAYFIVEDSIKFLKEFDKPIDFLYLDSYDFDPKNPRPAQEHNLNEYKAAEDKLHQNSILMIDDSHGTLEYPSGKAGLTTHHLLKNGWVCLMYAHQALFVRKKVT